MSEEANDANTGTENPDSAAPSADVELKPVDDGSGLVGTMEFEPTDVGAQQEEGEPDGADTSDGAEQSTPEGPAKEEQPPFHEHPRWKEMLENNNQLKRELARLKEGQKVPAQQQQQTKKYVSRFMSMDDETLQSKLMENPREVLLAFAGDLVHEVNQKWENDLSQKEQKNKAQAHSERVMQNIKAFFDDRPDGQEMLRDGRIQKFLSDNPAHNPISAYHELTRESAIEAASKAAADKAVNDYKQELKARQKNGNFANSRGNPVPNSEKSPEMRNPDKFGGRESVQLGNLRKRGLLQ